MRLRLIGSFSATEVVLLFKLGGNEVRLDFDAKAPKLAKKTLYHIDN
jgi:hypothetical protein